MNRSPPMPGRLMVQPEAPTGAERPPPLVNGWPPHLVVTFEWDRSDLNREPRDYAYHFGFRRPFRVCGLDHTFTLRVCRLVSTPSARGQLGSGLTCLQRER